MDVTEGDPVPVLDLVGLGSPAGVVDAELAVVTLCHTADGVSLDPWERALQEFENTMCWPHGGLQLSWFCHGRCPSVRT